MTTAFVLIPLLTLCLIVLAIWTAALWCLVTGRDDALLWAVISAVVTAGAGAFIWTYIDAGVISP